uniref:NAD-dependent epimerase/dehydratase family protein n=1 Tax=Algoriphagus sp. TaxID=1872435 RepID=UPI00404871C1
MKKVLITGINGFVGMSLQKALYGRYDVIGLARSSNGSQKDIITCDLVDKKNVSNTVSVLRGQHIDVVVHTASKMASAGNLNDISVLTDNIKMADNLAYLVSELKVPYLINLSSIAVYPNIDGEFDEESRVWPAANTDCLYGLSKFNSENILSYRLNNIAQHLLHLRIAMIYGEGMNTSRIIPVMIDEIKKKNEVAVFGNGERVLNLVEVNNLCTYIAGYILQPVSGVINVCDLQITLGELARNLVSEYGNAETRIYVETRGNKSRFRVNADKLQKIKENL